MEYRQQVQLDSNVGWQIVMEHVLARNQRNQCRITYLVTREDQCIRDNDVLPSAGSEDDNLSDIIRGQRLTAPTAKSQLNSENCSEHNRE